MQNSFPGFIRYVSMHKKFHHGSCVVYVCGKLIIGLTGSYSPLTCYRSTMPAWRKKGRRGRHALFLRLKVSCWCLMIVGG